VEDDMGDDVMLARVEPGAVARAEMAMSPEQVDLVKRTICKGATDDELRLFLHACKRMGLDPLAKQVHAVKRWDRDAGREVMSIQVGIDGFRVVAERSGKYAGQTPPEWCGPDGEWKPVWLSATPPAAARCGVLRSDFKEPIYGVARWSSYAQLKKDGSPTTMWARMPDVMLSKCSESIALRKAFPADLSGVYTPDEMGQADVPHHAEPEPQRKSLPATSGRQRNDYPGNCRTCHRLVAAHEGWASTVDGKLVTECKGKCEPAEIVEGAVAERPAKPEWKKNETEVECAHCNATMAPKEGWTLNGEAIHKACWTARKAERETAGASK
jgi:phage recombination protein Bet